MGQNEKRIEREMDLINQMTDDSMVDTEKNMSIEIPGERIDMRTAIEDIMSVSEREQEMLVHRERRMAIMIAAYAASSTKGANHDIER